MGGTRGSRRRIRGDEHRRTSVVLSGERRIPDPLVKPAGRVSAREVPSRRESGSRSRGIQILGFLWEKSVE